MAEEFPQLGGRVKERYHVTSKATGEPKYQPKSGNPKTALRFASPASPNFSHPEVYAMALGNFLHSISSAPKEYRRSGSEWYPKAHEAVGRALHGGFLSGHADPMWAGAGLFATVSPGMDWEASNVNALDELRNVSSAHWDALLSTSRSKKAGRERNQARVEAFGQTSLRSAKMASIVKAGRIIRGEDPSDVMPFSTNPKTLSFAHNIFDPSDAEYATIDGRAFDTMTNMARPWQYTGRGLSKGALPSGKTSRYEHTRDIVIDAALTAGLHPSAAQAVSWEHVKQHIELAGKSRKQGPERVGQPIFHTTEGHPVMHELAPYAHLLGRNFRSALGG